MCVKDVGTVMKFLTFSSPKRHQGDGALMPPTGFVGSVPPMCFFLLKSQLHVTCYGMRDMWMWLLPFEMPFQRRHSNILFTRQFTAVVLRFGLEGGIEVPYAMLLSLLFIQLYFYGFIAAILSAWGALKDCINSQNSMLYLFF